MLCFKHRVLLWQPGVWELQKEESSLLEKMARIGAKKKKGRVTWGQEEGRNTSANPDVPKPVRKGNSACTGGGKMS